MVSSRAAMEARLEVVERRLDALATVQQQQEALSKQFESLSQQIGEMMRERRGSRSPGREDERGSQNREPSPVRDQRHGDPEWEWGHGGGARRDGGRRGQGEQERAPRRDLGRRLDLPIFSGEDAYGWVVRVERYFRINGVEDDEKLEFALVAMEGEALVWCEWWETQVPCPTWREFKEDLVRRFQPGVARNPMGPLLNLKQTDSVLQYRKAFEAAANARKDLDREVVMCVFLHGLKPEIQAELKVSQFRSLTTLMDKALELEERNLAWRERGHG